MEISKFAGKQVPDTDLADIPKLISSYYSLYPDIENDEHLVKFGTSGHRGSSFKNNFNESHLLAITQALCDYRMSKKMSGPILIGVDTHALSEPAFRTVLEVMVANKQDIVIQSGGGYTPTPVISHAILSFNKNKKTGLADGILITPSHNPPVDGGIKYNATHGGPADTHLTNELEAKANRILKSGLKNVKRMAYHSALNSSCVKRMDFMMPYINDLKNIVDLESISSSGIKIGVDPLGGSGVHYWEPLADIYKLDLTVVNKKVDPTFSFMCADHDGLLRMDCSSPYAMTNLIKLGESYDIAFGNDPDFDRHGIVSGSHGLMNPNHFLAVAIDFLIKNRKKWPVDLYIGKTLVSSSMIDRVTKDLDRKLCEVPVGFKWFVDGLHSSSCAFAGEESAGASFLKFDGSVWSTDKDGIIMDLLAAEITAKTEMNPMDNYLKLEERHGSPIYERIDAPASREQKASLKNLNPNDLKNEILAGETILNKLVTAPGNGVDIGGLKVVTENAWFAARPSGTEDIYKIYAESFLGADHLKKVQEEAKNLVQDSFNKVPK